MLEMAVVVVFVVLVGLIAVQYFFNKNTTGRLEEYRQLFEESSSSERDTRTKIEEMFEQINRKDILLDRGAAALETTEASRKELAAELVSLQSQLVFQEKQYSKLFTQKKSSEVRTGKITEQLAPFLEDYPLDHKTAKFLGDPIDIVHFDEDKVTFVEVKSGKSQLSKRQRNIRKLIQDGKVEFIIYRVEGK